MHMLTTKRICYQIRHSCEVLNEPLIFRRDTETHRHINRNTHKHLEVWATSYYAFLKQIKVINFIFNTDKLKLKNNDKDSEHWKCIPIYPKWGTKWLIFIMSIVCFIYNSKYIINIIIIILSTFADGSFLALWALKW